MLKINQNNLKISELLYNLIAESDKENISFEEIVNNLSNEGFGLLIMIFAIPNILPIPGLSTITGIPIIFFSIQLIIGTKIPWLPNFIKKKSIKFESFEKIILKTIPYFQKIEYLFKPRINFFSTKLGKSIIGLSSLLFSIVLTLPIIFANAIPTIAISLLAVGLITKDGLAIIAGIIIGLFGILVAASIVLIGFETIRFFIKNFI